MYVIDGSLSKIKDSYLKNIVRHVAARAKNSYLQHVLHILRALMEKIEHKIQSVLENVNAAAVETET